MNNASLSLKISGKEFILKDFIIKKSEQNIVYLVLNLTDNLSTLKGLYFRPDKQLIQYLKGATNIKVWGDYCLVNNSEMLKINKINFPNNFYIDVALSDLFELVSTLSDEYCKKIIFSFLNDKIFLKKFSTCPGSLNSHHSFEGGLLKHTLGTMVMIDSYLKTERITRIRRDIAMAGAFLHDIGKIYLYDKNKLTDYGMLIGHTILGFMLFVKKTRGLKVPEKYIKVLSNIILSHHWSNYNNMEVKPLSKEALLVNKFDALDAGIDMEIA